MDNNKSNIIDLLVNVYNCEEKELIELTYEELQEKLSKEQKQAINNKKNPNSFFIIKDLPAPKNFETKTSQKGGVLVFIAFISVLLIFGAMMLWWAFK